MSAFKYKYTHGSVKKRLMCGGIFNHNLIANLLLTVPVKEFRHKKPALSQENRERLQKLTASTCFISSMTICHQRGQWGIHSC